VYYVDVDGKRISKAAVLLGRNIESDVALIAVRRDVMPDLREALQLDDNEPVVRLEIAPELKNDPEGEIQSLLVMGYPVAWEGRFKQSLVKLDPRNIGMDDTSNFGPLRKMKLFAENPTAGDLAEPGMSGGPVVDRYGCVVGLSVERPNDSNTLIALDMTHAAELEAGFADDEESCLLRFNPFDRILTIVRTVADCNYGSFG